MVDIETVKSYQKNGIGITYKSVSKPLEKGSSKLGGKPDLPKDFKWFYFQFEENNNVIKNPLSFLMQINCKDIHKYDKDCLLPETGMLYFFYELESMKWGFSPEDRGSARVFYYNGNIDELIPYDVPVEIKEQYIIPECILSFKSFNDYPNFEDFCAYEGIDEFDDDFDEYDYDAIKEKLGVQEFGMKLLGYPDYIQDNFFEECEAVAIHNIYYSGEIDFQGKEELIQENSKDWISLLQMDEIEIDDKDFSLPFEDMGNIFFSIRKNDLKNKNFDNIWLILQSF